MGVREMTKEEFIAEAKRRNLPKEEVYAKYTALEARGAFVSPKPVAAAAPAAAAPRNDGFLSENDVAAGRGRPEPMRMGAPKVEKPAKPIESLDHPPSRREWQALGRKPAPKEEREEAWRRSRPVLEAPGESGIYGPKPIPGEKLTAKPEAEKLDPQKIADAYVHAQEDATKIPEGAEGVVRDYDGVRVLLDGPDGVPVRLPDQEKHAKNQDDTFVQAVGGGVVSGIRGIPDAPKHAAAVIEQAGQGALQFLLAPSADQLDVAQIMDRIAEQHGVIPTVPTTELHGELEKPLFFGKKSQEALQERVAAEFERNGVAGENGVMISKGLVDLGTKLMIIKAATGTLPGGGARASGTNWLESWAIGATKTMTQASKVGMLNYVTTAGTQKEREERALVGTLYIGTPAVSMGIPSNVLAPIGDIFANFLLSGALGIYEPAVNDAKAYAKENGVDWKLNLWRFLTPEMIIDGATNVAFGMNTRSAVAPFAATAMAHLKENMKRIGADPKTLDVFVDQKIAESRKMEADMLKQEADDRAKLEAAEERERVASLELKTEGEPPVVLEGGAPKEKIKGPKAKAEAPKAEVETKPEKPLEKPVDAPKPPPAVEVEAKAESPAAEAFRQRKEAIAAEAEQRAAEAKAKRTENQKALKVRQIEQRREKREKFLAGEGRDEIVVAAEKTAGFPLQRMDGTMRQSLVIAFDKNGKSIKPKRADVRRVLDKDTVEVYFPASKGKSGGVEPIAISRLQQSDASAGSVASAAFLKDVPADQLQQVKADGQEWRKIMLEHPKFITESDVSKIEGSDVGKGSRSIAEKNHIREATRRALAMLGEDTDIDVSDYPRLSKLLPDLKALLEADDTGARVTDPAKVAELDKQLAEMKKPDEKFGDIDLSARELSDGMLVFANGEWHKVSKTGDDAASLKDGVTIKLKGDDAIAVRASLDPSDDKDLFDRAMAEYKEQEAGKVEAPVAEKPKEKSKGLKVKAEDKGIERITKELDSIEAFKMGLKQRAMRYQPDLKDEVGKAIGVDGTALDLPFEQWAAIEKAYADGDVDSARSLAKQYGVKVAEDAPKITSKKPSADLIPAEEQPFNLTGERVPDPKRVIEQKEREAENVRKAEDAQVKMDLGETPKPERAAYVRPAEKQAKLDAIKKEWREVAFQRGGMGIDPIDAIRVGSKFAAFYIDEGVRTFAQFAANVKADADDMWESVKPYLHRAWTSAAADAKADAGIDDITRAHAENIIKLIDSPKVEPPKIETEIPRETSIKQDAIDKELAARDQSPSGKAEVDHDKDLMDRAVSIANSDANAGTRLVDKIKRGYQPDNKDVALLLHETQARKNTESMLQKTVDELVKSNGSKDAIDQANKELAEAQERVIDILRVNETGDGQWKTMAGKLLSSLRMTIDEQFELQEMKRTIQNLQGRSNGEVSELTEAKLKVLSEEYKAATEALRQGKEAAEREATETRAKLDEALEKVAESSRMEEVVNKILERQAKPKRYTDSMRDWGKAELAAIEARYAARAGKLSVNPLDVTVLTDAARYAAAHIAIGTANWVDGAVKIWGEGIRPRLTEIKLNAQLLLDEKEGELSPEKSKGIKKKESADLPTEKSKKLIEKIYEFVIEQEMQIKPSGTPEQRAEWLRVDPLTKQVMQILKENFPEIAAKVDESQVRREFSNWGKQRGTNRSDVQKALIDVRQQAQLQESLLHVLRTGEAPPKSGLQREQQSDAARELKKQLDEAMRDAKVERGGDNKRRTAMQATETRLKNEITDLDKAIKTNTERPGPKAPEPYSDLAKQLLAQRDALLDTYRKMFPKGDTLTPQQRLDTAIKYADTRLARLHQEAANARKGVFKSKGKKAPLPESGYLDAVNMQIRLLSEETARLKAADPTQAYQKRLKQLQNIEAQLQKRIDDKNFGAKPKAEPFDVTITPEGLAATKRVAEARQQYSQMKEEARRAAWGPARIAGEYALNLVDLSRRVWSSSDFSGLRRQGGLVFWSDPAVWAKSVVPTVRAYSEKYSQKRWLQNTERENFKNGYYKRGKLRYVEGDGTGNFGHIDDVFQSKMADRIPNVKRSARAFATTLNELRFGLFDKLVENSENPRNLTDAELRDIGEVVNTWTGTSKLPFNLDARTLGLPFWAPGFVASGFKAATGSPWWTADTPYGRKVAVVRYAKAIGRLAALYGAIEAMNMLRDEDDQVEIEYNPTSSLFGSIRIGDYYLNPMNHVRPYLTLLSRGILGEEKSATTGERRLLTRGYHPMTSIEAARGDKAAIARIENGDKGFRRTYDDTVTEFLKTKRHPGISAISELYHGMGFGGKESNKLKTILTYPTPLVPRQIVSMVQSEQKPIDMAILSIAAILGDGPRADYDSPRVVRATQTKEEFRKKATTIIWNGTRPRASDYEKERAKRWLEEIPQEELSEIMQAKFKKAGSQRESQRNTWSYLNALRQPSKLKK
jgi:hypothetical protein